MNDGKITFLLMFSLIMAGMAVFRIIFCLGHLFKWKIRRCCYPEYKVYKFDMQLEFETMREQAKNWDESALDQTDQALIDRVETDGTNKSAKSLLASESFYHMNP